MKGTVIFLLLFVSVAAYSQTTVPLALRMDLVTWVKLEPKDYLAGGMVGTLDIKVRNYDVYQVPSGQYYINYTNSRLTQSRKYLGYAFGTHEYQGNTVFFNADTTLAWMWTIDRYGQIYKMDLPNHFATDARIKK